MSFIFYSFLFARDGERLARQRGGEDRKVFRPASQLERQRPASDAAEPVDCVVAADVLRADVSYVSTEYIARRKESACNQIFQPFAKQRIEIRIEYFHRTPTI